MVGRGDKAEFFTMCWAYGQCFIIMEQELNKKKTLDLSTFVNFEVEGTMMEYPRYLDCIFHVKFNDFKSKINFGILSYEEEAQMLC